LYVEPPKKGPFMLILGLTGIGDLYIIRNDPVPVGIGKEITLGGMERGEKEPEKGVREVDLRGWILGEKVARY